MARRPDGARAGDGSTVLWAGLCLVSFSAPAPRSPHPDAHGVITRRSLAEKTDTPAPQCGVGVSFVWGCPSFSATLHPRSCARAAAAAAGGLASALSRRARPAVATRPPSGHDWRGMIIRRMKCSAREKSKWLLWRLFSCDLPQRREGALGGHLGRSACRVPGPARESKHGSAAVGGPLSTR